MSRPLVYDLITIACSPLQNLEQATVADLQTADTALAVRDPLSITRNSGWAIARVHALWGTQRVFLGPKDLQPLRAGTLSFLAQFSFRPFTVYVGRASSLTRRKEKEPKGK